MSGNSKASPDVKANGFDPLAPIDPSKALIPSVIRVNEVKVAKSFWPKVRRVASKIPFAADVLSIWYCARDPQTPATAKGMILAALAYFILPIDAVPDVLAGIGFTDDAAVVAAVMAIIGRNLRPRHREAAQKVLKQMGGDS